MDFEGRDAVLLDPTLRLKQRTGAFNMSRLYVLDHMTMPITADQRWGNTWFTKANILDTAVADWEDEWESREGEVEGDAEMGE